MLTSKLTTTRRIVLLAGTLLASACGHDPQDPPRTGAYYRSHRAEWERRVWICIDDGSTLADTPACVDALLALRTDHNAIQQQVRLAFSHPVAPARSH